MYIVIYLKSLKVLTRPFKLEMLSAHMADTQQQRLEVGGPLGERFDEILSPAALDFVATLCDAFRPRIESLLAHRRQLQLGYDRGDRPRFRDDTREIRESEWRVAEIPKDLRDRRVEITGPVSRKMVINALNSGANMFMADFEDATAPTWHNVVDGQINLKDAVRREISFDDPVKGKSYRLADDTATLLVRPRGLHLPEAHITMGGRPVPGSLVDFGLFFFHNAKALLSRGSGPYFYIPKLQSHLEARLWRDVFDLAERTLEVPHGSIRATVLIETLPAAFEMDEILWELRDYSAGLNCGRWDYIFSYIKTLRGDLNALLPDRGQVGMTQPCMAAYTDLVIKTCHRRGIFAMGGMAAQIPIKGDPAANEAAFAKVRADKEREAKNGHDGTWVAHPGLVATAREVFDAAINGDNQIDKQRPDVDVSEADLLAVPKGTRSEAGLRQNVRVGIQYIEAWLRGNGCVPLYDLMEDAATAEISRAQVWQWQRHGAKLEDGRRVDKALVRSVIEDEMRKLADTLGEARMTSGKFDEARALFERLSLADELADFLTLPAYEQIVTRT